MSTTFATIFKNVRLDASMKGSVAVSDVEDLTRYVLDAYAEVMRLRPDIRLKTDGTMLARTLASTASTLPDELDELRAGVESYVRFRVHSKSGKDEQQAAQSSAALQQFYNALGIATSAPQTQGG